MIHLQTLKDLFHNIDERRIANNYWQPHIRKCVMLFLQNKTRMSSHLHVSNFQPLPIYVEFVFNCDLLLCICFNYYTRYCLYVTKMVYNCIIYNTCHVYGDTQVVGTKRGRLPFSKHRISDDRIDPDNEIQTFLFSNKIRSNIFK